MAVSSNRSPSPVSTRPNPNPRNPETNSTIRRSFSGNPFARPSVVTNPKSFNPVTPANSPADFGRRHTVGYEEKENESEKDPIPKPVKVRSPAVVKGTKNFMSPTISAASKFTPSPRKKILTERNDPVRSSLSFSESKPQFSSINLSDDSEESEPKIEMASIDPKNPELDQKEVVLETQNDLFLNSQSDCLSVDENSKIRPFYSESPIIAPLDADPSLPPYDPKKNYLSPRPQFLHYKPNPRIEVYLNKEGDKSLEESLMSEIFSDTDVTEETQSEDSQKESEDTSSVEMVTSEEEETHVSESEVITSAPIGTHVVREIEVKRVPKPRFFTRSKSISLILVFLIACLSISVTDSPVIDSSSVYEDLRFPKFYDDTSEIAGFAKSNLDGFARKFKDWSAISLSYLYSLVGIPGQGDELGLLQYSNLTALQDDLLVDRSLTVNHIHSEEILEESYQEVELETITEGGEVEIDPLEENGHPEVEEDDIDVDASEEYGNPEAEEIEMDSSEAIQTQSDPAFQFNSESQSGLVSEGQSVLLPDSTEMEASEFESQVVEPDIESIREEANLDRFSEMDSSFVDVQSSQALLASTSGSEDNFPVHYMLGISLLLVAIVAGTAFIYLKQKKTKAPNDQQVDPLLTKKLISNSELVYQERPSSQNWPTEDIVGESCPSEMSSFQKSLSYSNKGPRSNNEAQSQEMKPRKNPKRESLASSSDYSMGSPSYGSFTTYEKIPSKHGSGDDEIVTPVRRSSRIRSNVTSP